MQGLGIGPATWGLIQGRFLILHERGQTPASFFLS